MDLAGLPRELYDPSAMTRLNRYILRQCFGVMVFVTAALSAAIWLAQSLRLIDLIVNRGLSIDVFLYLAALILPRFLDIVLPIGVFIAVLFTFNRLTAESELVVMRSSGLSHVALAKPVLMLAGIAFLVLMSLSVYFLPASNRAFGRAADQRQPQSAAAGHHRRRARRLCRFASRLQNRDGERKPPAIRYRDAEAFAPHI